MKEYEIAILKKFENFNFSSKEKVVESFKQLWMNEKAYLKHLKKRIKNNHVKDDIDYVDKTLKCIAEVKECKIAIYNETDIWNRIRYFDNDEWVVIFAENGTLLTSHKKEIRELSFEEKHKNFGAEVKKGEINESFRDFFKELRTKFRIFRLRDI